MFLIQGVFFQQQGWLELRAGTEGTGAVIREGLVFDMYAGFFQVIDGVIIQGSMLDHYGESRLSDFIFTQEELSFTKRYCRRQDTIRYSFRLKDGLTWVGQYSGDETGTGVSRCLVTEVPDGFFDCRLIVQLLGVKDAHHWEP